MVAVILGYLIVWVIDAFFRMLHLRVDSIGAAESFFHIDDAFEVDTGLTGVCVFSSVTGLGRFAFDGNTVVALCTYIDVLLYPVVESCNLVFRNASKVL